MTEATKIKVVPLRKETYLQVIKNSVGTNMFRNCYAEVNGEKRDITDDGDLSCAFFVSSILTVFRLIKEVHAAVSGTVKDLEDSGWQKTAEPKPGDVVVWAEQTDEKGESHGHIGFCIGENQAVSNNSQARTPTIHNLDYRPVVACYTREI